MELRPYQREAVEAVYDFLRTRDDHPCVVIPTAGGKTPIMATICRDAVQVWDGRVLIVAHVKELLEQAAEKLSAIAPDLPVGVYSAGLKRRDLGYAVTVAGIHSVYQRACDVGGANLVIVDEAHLISPDGEGMYRSFLADMKTINPQLRVVGMTATPFRMKSGAICGPDNILNAVCYQIGVRELIVQGYLCPLRTKAGSTKPDTDKLHVRGGEFVANEVEALMDDRNLVFSACREIVEQTSDRKSVLIFASGVRHGQHICEVLTDRHRAECGFVCGETLPFDRERNIQRFRAGTLKYLCNVNVLTTGFDAPNIDCVAMVRPTLSAGLYYQMVGRGFRLHPGKANCLVLDFGGNVLRHGPVDQLRIAENTTNGDGEPPVKECPQCRALIAAGYANCPECGHTFPARDRSRHDPTASSEGILSDQVSRHEHEVVAVQYGVHCKRGAPAEGPRSLRVDYRVALNEVISEWVCLEHDGFARQKAVQWWKRRSKEGTPSSAEEAAELARAGPAPTLSILVERKAAEPFDRIVAYRLGDVPPRLDSEEGLPSEIPASTEEGVPF